MAILVIGGTDPGGAGLQTDWQVVHHLTQRFDIHASSVVSAVTAQNSEGVFDQGILPYEQIKAQFNTLKNQTFSAIKIGMLGNQQVIKAVIEFIKTQTPDTFIIVDPVLASSSGGALLNPAGIQSLLTDLLPLVSLITPNANELALLTQRAINNHQELESAAQSLIDLGASAVLVKGGHFQVDKSHTTDVFMSSKGILQEKEKAKLYLKGQRWENKENVRGTGCALATAIACFIDQGHSLNDAVVVANALISGGIRHVRSHDKQQKLHFQSLSNQTLFERIDLPHVFNSEKALNTHYHFKRCETNQLGIYPVVDSVEWLKKLIPLGIQTIQLRIKDKQDEDVEGDIVAAIEYGKTHQTRLFINDYWQLAIKHKAYGIHLGQEDLDKLSLEELSMIAESGCRLGISTHSYTEVARACAIKPSYLALGPIFETTSKEMPWIPQGVTAVQNWVDFFQDEYPLVAIGGINLKRAKALKQTGVGSVAMISAITEADDYAEATREMMSVFR